MVLTALRRLLVRPRARLRDAEDRFLDAHGRGGALRGRELVLPADYLQDARVERVLTAWLVEGAPIDWSTLERVWRESGRDGSERAFYRNVATVIALVGNPRMMRVSWRDDDGRLLSPNSPLLD